MRPTIVALRRFIPDLRSAFFEAALTQCTTKHLLHLGEVEATLAIRNRATHDPLDRPRSAPWKVARHLRSP